MPFKQPDCLLVRVGELALKSESVQRRMFSMLLDNMRAALKGVNFKFELMPNRIFVFTLEIKKATKKLQKVFGIVSVSPAWVCHSDLDEIKVLAVDVAEKALKLNPRKSFAIRPHRVGRHPFTKRAIAEEAGAAVKRVTGARVNLSKPDVEIFIECRSRKTYIFMEKIPCAGGLPLGVSGRAIAIINGPDAAVSAWLMMKRGVELIVLANRRSRRLVTALKRWHVGRKMLARRTEGFAEFKELAEKEKIHAVITGCRMPARLKAKLAASELLVLRPTAGWSPRQVAETAARAGMKT